MNAIALYIVTSAVDASSSAKVSKDIAREAFSFHKGFTEVIVFPVGTCYSLQGMIAKIFLIIRKSFGDVFQPGIGGIHAEAIGGARKRTWIGAWYIITLLIVQHVSSYTSGNFYTFNELIGCETTGNCP